MNKTDSSGRQRSKEEELQRDINKGDGQLEQLKGGDISKYGKSKREKPWFHEEQEDPRTRGKQISEIAIF